jgi:hypothetical protein
VLLSRDSRSLLRSGGVRRGGGWGGGKLVGAIEGGRGLVSTVVGGRDLVRETVGLILGSSREVGVSNDRSRLGRRADVVNGSNGEVRAAVGGGGLLVGGDGSARLLGGSSSGVLGRG